MQLKMIGIGNNVDDVIEKTGEKKKQKKAAGRTGYESFWR